MTTFFKVESVLEKISNISLYIINSIDEYIKMKIKPYLKTVTSKLVENTKA
jgi:hypothetical protein